MDNDVELYRSFQRSPLVFIEKVWGLTPQPVRPEFQALVDELVRTQSFDQIGPDYFGAFERGKHVTWQQWLIFKAVEQAIQGLGKKKISVVSGHGIGKDASLSMLIPWYLFCFKDAQVPCTAPTADLLHDILWKELSVWLAKMPPSIGSLFEWSAGYLKVKERPNTWFARARTARKEAPEAIAGVHGDFVFVVADEASGVPEEVFKTAEGSLTGENVLVVLISNGTRNIGYFYNTHHQDKDSWATLAFDSEQSPIVDHEYVERIALLYGRDSDEFKIRVRGGFPNAEVMDAQGWVPLISDKFVNILPDGIPFIGERWMGVDPAGDGDDQAVWVIRDNFQAKVVAKEAISTPKSIAQMTMLLMQEYEVKADHVFVDNLGEGANVTAELLKLDHTAWVNGVNWASEAEDTTVYFNKRAECCLRARDWLKRGGATVGDELKREVCGFMFKNNLRGLKQIMDKPNLRKLIGKSPDRADAMFLTFYTSPTPAQQAQNQAPFDPYSVL